jgi:glycosyltransferase involved in cell wall biosynthesis
MRIGIYAQPLSRQLTGIGNYVKGLVELLPRIAPEHEYVLYSNRPTVFSCSDGEFRHQVDWQFRMVPGAIWLLGRGARLARHDRLDVYWATTAILPLGMPHDVLKVVTVYDMVWLRYPETSTRYNVLVQTLCARKAIAEADSVVVISRSVQDELIDALNVPREKINLVYPGVAGCYRPQSHAEAAEYISHKYGVPQRYLATAGIVHPRKNQQFLARVMGILKNNGRLNCPLLVAGSIGWKNSRLFLEIKAAGLTENDIRFLGYIPDEDMPRFYAGAQAFLFPTLYEGFGLPPVEAMACGTPVIASDSPAMPEVLGDAAILLPLADPNGFAAAISAVLSDAQLRKDLRSKGIQRAQHFRYESSSRQLLEIFEGARRPLSAEAR